MLFSRLHIDLLLKLSSSFDTSVASQAGVSLTGLAIKGDFSTSAPLPPSEVKSNEKR